MIKKISLLLLMSGTFLIAFALYEGRERELPYDPDYISASMRFEQWGAITFNQIPDIPFPKKNGFKVFGLYLVNNTEFAITNIQVMFDGMLPFQCLRKGRESIYIKPIVEHRILTLRDVNDTPKPMVCIAYVGPEQALNLKPSANYRLSLRGKALPRKYVVWASHIGSIIYKPFSR